MTDKSPATEGSGVRVLLVKAEEYGPVLIIQEYEKDTLWDYAEDWAGKLYIEFATMTQAEIDALPEFEGF